MGGSTSLSLFFLGYLIYTWSHHILWGLWQLFCSVCLSYVVYIRSRKGEKIWSSVSSSQSVSYTQLAGSKLPCHSSSVILCICFFSHTHSATLSQSLFDDDNLGAWQTKLTTQFKKFSRVAHGWSKRFLKKTLLAHLTHSQRKSSTQAPHKVIKRADNKAQLKLHYQRANNSNLAHELWVLVMGFDLQRLFWVLVVICAPCCFFLIMIGTGQQTVW